MKTEQLAFSANLQFNSTTTQRQMFLLHYIYNKQIHFLYRSMLVLSNENQVTVTESDPNEATVPAGVLLLNT